MTTAILRLREVQNRTGLSRSTIYDRLDPKSKRYDPAFPRPVALGVRAIGFHAHEVARWCEQLERKGPQS
jgi:prophage regulatory protein